MPAIFFVPPLSTINTCRTAVVCKADVWDQERKNRSESVCNFRKIARYDTRAGRWCSYEMMWTKSWGLRDGKMTKIFAGTLRWKSLVLAKLETHHRKGIRRGYIKSCKVLPPFFFIIHFRQLALNCFGCCLNCLQRLIKVNRGSMKICILKKKGMKLYFMMNRWKHIS